MFYNNIDPVLIHVGPFEIRYYGLIFILGFVLAYFFVQYLSKLKKIDISKEQTVDLLTYIGFGTIIGARLFYVVFYNFAFFIENPLTMFSIWNGGLSFHGGLVGAVIAGHIYSQKIKIKLLKLADLLAIPLAIGLFLGRIGNFLNSELVGRVTDVSWGVNFNGEIDTNGDSVFRHPSQLYESLKNLFIFSSLWFLKNNKLKDGTLFYTFIVMYSVLRFLIEFVRAPDPQLGFIIFSLTMGQLLNIAMLAIGIILIYYNERK